MSLQDELQWLFNLNRFGEPGLDYIAEALEKFGNPHKKLRVIQITGTNGKGSTAAMIAEVLKRAGKKVGLYTSPNLIRFNERIRVNGVEISDNELLELIHEVKGIGVRLKFFEFGTVMALLYFTRKKVDFAVLEVGLGGKNDPTSICDAEIAVLTSIGFDHMHILGHTVEDITKEKTGIIKEKSKVVTCYNNAGLPWIKEACTRNKLIVAPNYNSLVGLRGPHQRINAGIAYEVCKLLEIDEHFIEEGIAQVKWPGRMEYFDKNLLVDCAHNLSALKVIAPYVKTIPKKKLIVIFGVLADKDYKKMIKALPRPDFLILTKPPIDRALDPSQLIYDGPCAVIAEPSEALRYARSIAKPDDLIFITGSIYLVGRIMDILRKSESAGKVSALPDAHAFGQMNP